MAEQLPDPIIVYGAPRSGTTYLQELLNAHPDVFVSHETRIFAWLHHALNEATQDRRYLVTHREEFGQHLRTVLPGTIRDFYRSLAPEARYWGDKNPQYADHTDGDCLQTIGDLFPGAWFVHVIRDGRDVVSSLIRKRTEEGQPWAWFEGAHHFWVDLVDRGCTFGRSLSPGRYFELRYERLVTDDVAAARELFAFLGLDLHPAVEAFCRAQQEQRTPFSGPTRSLAAGAGRSDWASFFAPGEKLRSLELIGDCLVQRGYETEESLAAAKAELEVEARATSDRRQSGQRLTILTGLAGSGKSAHLIERVKAARDEGRTVATFACSESPRLQADQYVREWRLIGSRVPGLECSLDHFVSGAEASEILDRLDPGGLAAFEEAYEFSAEIVPRWIEASKRGVEVLVSMPSQAQLLSLAGTDFEELRFTIVCESCGREEATGFVLAPTGDGTLALCPVCDEEREAAVRDEIVERLRREEPFPGEEKIYQPVELDECSGWQSLRPDSRARADLMVEVLGALGLLADGKPGRLSYLDVGCNTGFFCHALQRLGFYAEGVDVTKHSIEIARQLTSFVRRDRSVFTLADCYDYLRDTQERAFDVTSAFSVFQWLMIQRSVEHGLDCLRWLFAKTRAICFLELGYSAEEHYRGQLGVEIDRDWVIARMEELGDFSAIGVFEAEPFGLMRDLFVGLNPAAGPAGALEAFGCRLIERRRPAVVVPPTAQ